MELFFNEADLPVLVILSQVGQVVGAIDINGIKLKIAGRYTIFFEPLVQHQVVFFQITGKLTPYNYNTFFLPVKRR